eukprot:1161826-Pelagomonas_calceolata.AAC.5
MRIGKRVRGFTILIHSMEQGKRPTDARAAAAAAVQSMPYHYEPQGSRKSSGAYATQFLWAAGYQCLAPAVRSGCLVISYDTAPFGPGCTLEEMSKEVLPEAKEWAQEQGLLEPGEDLLTVQTPAVWGPPSNAARHLACRSTYWDSALDGQPSPVYCMAVHTPFLVPNPDSSTPASSTQEQPFQQQDNHAETGQAMRKQGHAEFELTIYAPNTDLELRGWQGSTDAPEDLPDAVKSRSLCLLATLGGQFLGVTVKEERPSRNEERVVQVRVCTSSIFVALLWTST